MPAPALAQTWAYNNAGQVWWTPGTSGTWINLDYSDASWPTGLTPMGYGGDMVYSTVLASNSNFPSTGALAYYYFRIKICIPSAVLAKVRWTEGL